MTFTVEDGFAWIEALDFDVKEVVVPDTYQGYPVAGFSQDFFYARLYERQKHNNEEDRPEFNRPFVYLPKHFDPFVSIENMSALTVFFSDFKIHDESVHVTIEDGIMYSKDFTEIIMYTKEYEPTSVLSFRKSITSLHVGKGLNHKAVEEIVIHDRIRSVASGVHYDGFHAEDHSYFASFLNLARITVDEDNPDFKDVDGVLFTKDMKTLIRYPSKRTGSSYTVPKEVERILKLAFSGTRLDVLLFEEPSSCVKIGRETFGCLGARKVILPQRLQSLHRLAFHGWQTHIGEIALSKALDNMDELRPYIGALRCHLHIVGDGTRNNTNQRRNIR
jgi:hypothetical protein